MRRRVLVTGGSGFAGRHLLALLSQTRPAADLHAWRRDPHAADNSAAALAERHVTWHPVDVLDRDTVRASLDAIRPGEIYHLAGASHAGASWRNPAATLDVNVIGTHVLLDALRVLQLTPRVLVAGSGTVYAPGATPLDEDSPIAATTPYAHSKLAQEMLALRAFVDEGLPVMVARAFNHLGPGQDPSFFAPAFARQLAAIEQQLAQPLLRVGNLDVQRDLTDVRDTVHAYALLMERGTPGRPYNVCSGSPRYIRDVLDEMIRRCGVEVTVEVDPARLRLDEPPILVGSFQRLQAETGWRPVVPFAKTLDDLLDDARSAARSVPDGGTGRISSGQAGRMR
jgi:GDP-4-dehydro-6-deoxy-D-mannose reductase